ncbi:INSYN2B protein-like [Lacerta agilis]|uniref:INSYN2B protein-like n=1 Tax=Lacerta agilis TaxID=80427 RepID=UPI001419A75A|nr:INSYN2B protein-like [Lacerta agilis]
MGYLPAGGQRPASTSHEAPVAPLGVAEAEPQAAAPTGEMLCTPAEGAAESTLSVERLEVMGQEAVTPPWRGKGTAMASQGAAPEAGQEKAATGVRSVLLKRDSPGAEDHLQPRRRRHRAQQVRFKDLEEGGEEPPGSGTPRASAANCARRSWPHLGPAAACPAGSPQGDGHQHLQPDVTQPPQQELLVMPPVPGAGAPVPLGQLLFPVQALCPSTMQPLGTPSSCGSSGAPWLCPPPLCLISSEQASRAPPCAPQRGIPSPSPLAQGPPTKDPTPAFLLPTAGPPKSGKPAAPAASPESLSTTQAHPTAPTPSRKPPDPLLPSSGRSCPPETCLSARPGETFPCVQDHLLQLVSVAQGLPCPAAAEREPPPASQDLPGQVGDIHSQLQSLEGVLETSQRTIKVLLDVIQDLEKKEAQRDGRQSYRTGQDTTNCGTCLDCACIIYSVEHDFRKQEGRLKQVLSTIEPELSHSPLGAMRAATPSHQEPSTTLNLPVVKAEPKKSWRKCFWFL